MPKHIVQAIIENAGYECRSYSGRGMYGKECVATDPGPTLGECIADLVQAARDDSQENSEKEFALDQLQDALRNIGTDSMGLGTVLYFKNVPYTSEDEDGDEEDGDA